VITQAWIEERIKKVIDQHFQEAKHISDKEWLKTQRLHYIGGIMQTALFLLPLDKYFELVRYCYDTYGYDPGGAQDSQLTFKMLMTEE
jgi:hypothetical protein